MSICPFPSDVAELSDFFDSYVVKETANFLRNKPQNVTNMLQRRKIYLMNNSNSCLLLTFSKYQFKYSFVYQRIRVL